MNNTNENLNNLNILIIEDLQSDALLIEKQLSIAFQQNYTLEIAKTLEEGLLKLDKKKFTVVLLDRSLPDADGFDGLLRLQNIAPYLPIIFMTAHKNSQFVSEAIMNGAQDYLVKGECDATSIKRAVEFAVFRKKYDAVLIERANFDLLTGLGNRGLFENRLKLEFCREKRQGGLFVVGFLDIDKFNDINDKYGHLAGDLVLKEVGARLRGAIRGYDVAARLGGDEFGLICEGIKCVDDVDQIAKKIIHLFDTPIKALEFEIMVEVSLGIRLCVDNHTTDFNDIIRYCDMLMYEAKKVKGNSYFTKKR